MNVAIESSSPVFIQGKYQGSVVIDFLEENKTGSLAIQVTGKRLVLRTFQGSFQNELLKLFGNAITPNHHEFEDMKEIFGSNIAHHNYSTRIAESDEAILKRIEFNAQRAVDGNPFTGFAAIDKTTQKMIGFVSIGCGYQKGESQSGMILNPRYWGKSYGLETALLAGCLALFYAKNEFEVGPRKDLGPVRRFTVTALDSNEKSISLIQKLGLIKIRALTEKERYTEDPACLYGIEAQDLEGVLERFIDLKKITWKILNLT